MQKMQDSDSTSAGILARRVGEHVSRAVAIDEVGYLSYDTRYVEEGAAYRRNNIIQTRLAAVRAF
jgi:hypothetical protein